MKKGIAVIATALVLLCFAGAGAAVETVPSEDTIAGYTAEPPYEFTNEIDHSEGDWYYISTAEEWNEVAADSSYDDTNLVLKNDLVCDGITQLKTMTLSGAALYGNGHVIRGFTFDSANENEHGLYYRSNDEVTMNDVQMVECSIHAESGYAGGLIGLAGFADLYGCSAVACDIVSGGNIVGGLVGCTWNADLYGCSAVACDIVSDGYSVGGMIGWAGGIVTLYGCEVLNGKVASSGGYCVGGQVGYAHTTSLNGCSTRNCSIYACSGVGGLIGYSTSVSLEMNGSALNVVENCRIESVSDSYAGGLIGNLGYDDGSLDAGSCQVKNCWVGNKTMEIKDFDQEGETVKASTYFGAGIGAVNKGEITTTLNDLSGVIVCRIDDANPDKAVPKGVASDTESETIQYAYNNEMLEADDKEGGANTDDKWIAGKNYRVESGEKTGFGTLTTYPELECETVSGDDTEYYECRESEDDENYRSYGVYYGVGAAVVLDEADKNGKRYVLNYDAADGKLVKVNEEPVTSPVPIAGILAGLGAAAVLLKARRH